MPTVGDSKSEPQPKNPRNPKRPAVVKTLTSNGYTIQRVIMRPDGSTEYVLANGSRPEPATSDWDEILANGGR